MDPDLLPTIPRMAHLVGICGSGMRALAEYLHDRGWRLSGSDLTAPERTVSHLSQRGIPLRKGHAPHHLPADAELLIYSPVIGEANPERLAAAELGIAQISYVDFVAALTRQHPTICVAGTHGKSTTTAMIAHILQSAGWDPSVICGAGSIADGTSGRGGTGKWLVLESCEYRGHLLKYRPGVAVVTGIEPDHFDCFCNGDSTDVFRTFVANVPEDGIVVTFRSSCPDPPHLGRCSAAVVEFSAPIAAQRGQSGANGKPGWSAVELRLDGIGTWFRVLRNGKDFGEFHLNVPGDHNVINALAAIAMCGSLGITRRLIADGLEQFHGLKRRFEIRHALGATFVDDYAHHPTAIRFLLKAARQVFPGSKLRCAFQPHQLSRTRMLLQQFADAFEVEDEVLVLPVFPAREQSTDDHVTASKNLVSLLRRAGKSATFVDDLDHLARTLETSVTSKDVVLTIGAGDIDRLYHEFA